MRSAVVDLGGQPFRNLARAGKGTYYSSIPGGFTNDRWAAFSIYTIVTGATDCPIPGQTSYARLTVTGGGRTALGFHHAGNPEQGAPVMAQALPVSPGKTLTMAVWVRTSVAATSMALRYKFIAGTVWTGATIVGPTVTTVAGVWTRLTATGVVPADATHVSIYTNTGATLTDGVTFDGCGFMVLDGADRAVYCDGDTPGWRWTGTAGASDSVGWPYTLESIAGRPLAIRDTPGVTTIAASDPTPKSGFSLYGIYGVPLNTIGTSGSASAMATVGKNATHNPVSLNGSAEIRTQWTNGTGQPASTYFRSSQDDGGAGFNTYQSSTTGRELDRKHVASLVVKPDGSGQAAIDSTVQALTTMTWTAGISLLYLDLGDPATYSTPVAAAVWRGNHSEPVRLAVSAWLANRYGAALPA